MATLYEKNVFKVLGEKLEALDLDFSQADTKALN